MVTDHDKRQDDRIAANAEAIRANAETIRQQTEYLHEIRNHFIPDEEARLKRFAYGLKPDAFRTLVHLGDVYVKAGQVPQALNYYDRAIAINPAYAATYAHKADALAGLGREAEALKAVEKAIETTTFKPERFWVQKGALLERLKRPSDAREAYAKARTLNPKLLVAWRKELELAQAAGDTAAADAARAKCLELDPMGKK